MQCCGGKCFYDWPVAQLKEFMAQKHIYFDGIEKTDIIAAINNWAKTNMYVACLSLLTLHSETPFRVLLVLLCSMLSQKAHALLFDL